MGDLRQVPGNHECGSSYSEHHQTMLFKVYHITELLKFDWSCNSLQVVNSWNLSDTQQALLYS